MSQTRFRFVKELDENGKFALEICILKYKFIKVKKRIDRYYIFYLYLCLVLMQTYCKIHCLFMYEHCLLFFTSNIFVLQNRR